MAAYFVWHNRIHDAEKMQEYLSKVLETMAPYHPEVVVLDEHVQVVEGNAPGPRTIVIKFDSRDTAMAWYNCPSTGRCSPAPRRDGGLWCARRRIRASGTVVPFGPAQLTRGLPTRARVSPQTCHAVCHSITLPRAVPNGL